MDRIANDFRAAILAGDHAGAKRLVAEYAEAVRQAWELVPPQERAVSQIPVQARELLAWAADMTIAQRRITSQQLELVETATRYRRSAPLKSHTPALEVRI